MSFPLPPPAKRKDTDYEVGELLGRGNFTSVYRAVEIATGKKVALKIVDRYRCEKLKKTPDLHMEKHCLRRTNHPNIIKMLAHFTDTLTVYVVMEECLGGELWDSVKTVGCPDPAARFYFAQLLNAIEYLRQARIVHRDLKCENVMLADGGIIKLIDFGTAKDLENPQIKGAGNAARRKVFDDYVGTPQFMPPEVIENKCSDFRSDTWSLGCTFYQTLIGVPPFHAASEYLVFCKIMDMKLEFPLGVHPQAKDMVTRMITRDADSRLGANDLDDIKTHPYMADQQYEDLHKKPPPVPTLVDICTQFIGRNIKEMQRLIDGWEEKSQLKPEVAAVLERMKASQKWFDDALPPEGEC